MRLAGWTCLIKQILRDNWKQTVRRRLEGKNEIAAPACETLSKIERFGKASIAMVCLDSKKTGL